MILTLLGLGFITVVDGNRRAWNMTLQESAGGPIIPVLLNVHSGTFSAVTAISYGDLDPNELCWKLQGHVPFVCMERHASQRLHFISRVPIDLNPPHVLPQTIHVAMNAVFSAAVFFMKEYPQQVRSENLAPSLGDADEGPGA